MRRKRRPETTSIYGIIELKQDPREGQCIDDVRRRGASHTAKRSTYNTINIILREPGVTVKLIDQTPSKTATIRPTNNIINPKLIANSPQEHSTAKTQHTQGTQAEITQQGKE